MNGLPSEPRPRRKLLRGWRGIVLLAGLLLLLVVACLPWIAGSFAPGFASRAFGERFQGQLEVGRAQLSWFGRQTLKDLVLRDPQGAEVARLDLELPSLWQLVRGGGQALGTLRAELRAALVADDQGLTNLERALAPRQAASVPVSGSSPASAGPEPELELELTSPLCSWSDARTRASGKAFEIRGLRAHLALQSGGMARFEAHADLAGEEAGKLELEAQVDGLRTQGGFAFAKARGRGKIQGFSSAMLDGLAQQKGRLEQVLGPRFDLSFELADLGPSSGTLACALQSERTHLVLEGRVQDGFLRLTEQRGLALELGEPRAFVAGYLEPLLPPGTSLVWPATSAPWKLDCATLALPLSGAELFEILGRAEIDLQLSIPGPIGFENEITRAANLHPSLSAVAGRIVAGGGKPLALTLDARLQAGETGTLHAELQANDPWRALARNDLPVVDARIEVQDISNAALDALLGRQAFLSEGFGRVLDLRVALSQASLAGGTLDLKLHSANIDLGVRGNVADGNLVGSDEHALDLRFAPGAAWIERQLAPFVPEHGALRFEAQPLTANIGNFSIPLRAADLEARLAGMQANYEIHLPAVSFAPAGGPPFSLGTSILRGALGRGGRCALRFDLPLASPKARNCFLQGDFPGLGSLLGGTLPPLSFDLTLEQLDTASLEPWLASAGRAPALLGEKLDLKLRAEQLSLQAGTLDLLLHSAKLEARLSLTGDRGTWRSSGAEGERVTLALAASDLERELKPYLPPGTELALASGSGALELRVRELALTLPPDPAQPFGGLRAKLELALPDCSFANALTRQAGIEPGLAQAKVQAELADKGELALVFDAGIGVGQARLHAQVRGSSLSDGRASLRVEALPCSVVDALAGQPAALSGLLGDTLELTAEFEGKPGGTGALKFALHAPHGEAGAAGRLEPGAFVLAEPEGLHLRLEPTDAWLAGALPGLRRAEGAPKPFDLRLHSERIALPQGEQTWIDALAGTLARLELELPDFVWSDAAGQALELRDLALRAELLQEPGSKVVFGGKLVGEPPGDLAFEFRALDALALLAQDGGPGRFRIAAHGSAHGVPVAVVDALAGQGGLLLEALGARADLTLESAGLSLEAGTFVLDLVSPYGPTHFDGEVRDGVLRVTKPKGASAHFSLGPLTSTRFVGRVVPLVCELSKPKDAAPALVEVDALAFPLDGDLAKLDGLLRIDLGEVSFAILPGLSGLFGSQGAAKPVHLPVFAVPIQKGVVRYDKLLLPFGGRDYDFRGSYNLVDGQMQLGTQIPLELLGVKVSSELDKARGLIDGKTLVPIEIRGTWNKPRFAVGQKFIDDTVKKALGSALEKGLEGLLKKKKP